MTDHTKIEWTDRTGHQVHSSVAKDRGAVMSNPKRIQRKRTELPDPQPGFTYSIECISCGYMAHDLEVHILTGVCTRCAPANAIGRRERHHATATW